MRAASPGADPPPFLPASPPPPSAALPAAAPTQPTIPEVPRLGTSPVQRLVERDRWFDRWHGSPLARSDRLDLCDPELAQAQHTVQQLVRASKVARALGLPSPFVPPSGDSAMVDAAGERRTVTAPELRQQTEAALLRSLSSPPYDLDVPAAAHRSLLATMDQAMGGGASGLLPGVTVDGATGLATSSPVPLKTVTALPDSASAPLDAPLSARSSRARAGQAGFAPAEPRSSVTTRAPRSSTLPDDSVARLEQALRAIQATPPPQSAATAPKPRPDRRPASASASTSSSHGVAPSPAPLSTPAAPVPPGGAAAVGGTASGGGAPSSWAQLADSRIARIDQLIHAMRQAAGLSSFTSTLSSTSLSTSEPPSHAPTQPLAAWGRPRSVLTPPSHPYPHHPHPQPLPHASPPPAATYQQQLRSLERVVRTPLSVSLSAATATAAANTAPATAPYPYPAAHPPLATAPHAAQLLTTPSPIARPSSASALSRPSLNPSPAFASSVPAPLPPTASFSTFPSSPFPSSTLPSSTLAASAATAQTLYSRRLRDYMAALGLEQGGFGVSSSRDSDPMSRATRRQSDTHHTAAAPAAFSSTSAVRSVSPSSSSINARVDRSASALLSFRDRARARESEHRARADAALSAAATRARVRRRRRRTLGDALSMVRGMARSLDVHVPQWVIGELQSRAERRQQREEQEEEAMLAREELAASRERAVRLRLYTRLKARHQGELASRGLGLHAVPGSGGAAFSSTRALATERVAERAARRLRSARRATELWQAQRRLLLHDLATRADSAAFQRLCALRDSDLAAARAHAMQREYVATRATDDKHLDPGFAAGIAHSDLFAALYGGTAAEGRRGGASGAEERGASGGGGGDDVRPATAPVAGSGRHGPHESAAAIFSFSPAAASSSSSSSSSSAALSASAPASSAHLCTSPYPHTAHSRWVDTSSLFSRQPAPTPASAPSARGTPSRTPLRRGKTTTAGGAAATLSARSSVVPVPQRSPTKGVTSPAKSHSTPTFVRR